MTLQVRHSLKKTDAHRAHIRFDGSQSRELQRAFVAEEDLTCPACGVPMDVQSVPPRADVSYVRHRAWATCPECHRGAILDRREAR